MSETTGYVEAQREWRLLENWRDTSAMARAALNIHQPGESANRVICCECIDPEGSAVDWPCRTYAAIREAARG